MNTLYNFVGSPTVGALAIGILPDHKNPSLYLDEGEGGATILATFKGQEEADLFEMWLDELLDKIQRDIDGIDMFVLPRAMLCGLIRKQTAENARLLGIITDLRAQAAQQWMPVATGSITCDAGGPICVSEDNEIAINQGVLSIVYGEWATLPANIQLCRRTQPNAGAETQP